MNNPLAGATTGWPAHLRPGSVRFTRSSSRYEETIYFYREVVGLPVIETFAASFGEDGTIFGLPGTGTHLEIVRGVPEEQLGVFDQLVLYFEDRDGVDAALAPLHEHGLTPDPEAHPYWHANGAVQYRDPDGRGVVFAPWVYGRDPEPVDAAGHSHSVQPTHEPEPIEVGEYAGDRSLLRSLFEFAEDSATQLEAYIDAGRVIVARQGSLVLGHLQLVPTDDDAVVELKNMAVLPRVRGTGVGRALVSAALGKSRDERRRRVLVATAAADIGNLRFYQRCGFRFESVERDAFTPESGYPDPILIDGIPLLDRIWLSQDL